MYDNINLLSLINRNPEAIAMVTGSVYYPDIYGTVKFYETAYGVIVSSHVTGLPKKTDTCSSPIFAFHIHSGDSCTGNSADYFADALTHYNPKNCAHPYHAGDMPPLFGCRGLAFSAFLTDRFSVRNIIGKTVIIHSYFDDFTTQPSGNAGTKIACGGIMP